MTMDREFTNEEAKKLVNYYYQLTTFALSMQDEMKVMNASEWEKIACDLIKISNNMNEHLTKIITGKVCH